MNDRQVFIFGSFTEDETRSLHNGPLKNNDFTFGSLDSETLRSVGLYDSRALKFPGKEENSLISGISRLDENGISSAKSRACDSSRQLILSHKEPQISASFKTANDFSNVSSLEQPGKQSEIELSSSLNNVALCDPTNGIHQMHAKHNISKVSVVPNVIPRNFLPRGLINSGNLCFLNATLQALLSCSSFSELLHELRSQNITETGYPTLSAFVKFFSEFDMPADSICKMKEKIAFENGKSFRPVMFESVLKSFTPDIPDNLSGRPRQEDAQEFLSFVMHQMHDELLKLDGQILNGTGKEVSLVSSTDDENGDNWETVGPRNKSAITRTQSYMPSKLSAIFGGQLRSVVKARGSKASATIEPFLLLHLNICPEPVSTIEDALRLFSAPETLEGYRTSAAGKAEVVTASKYVRILELSEIMVLHLMRFSYGSQGSTKLHKAVHFPLELVVGRELLATQSSEGKRYELVATITHHGRDPSKGHYTADARHPDGKWLRYDDASFTPIHESKVLHDQAYVLFYKRL